MKLYETPYIELIRFKTEDVLTASNGNGDDDEVNLPMVPYSAGSNTSETNDFGRPMA